MGTLEELSSTDAEIDDRRRVGRRCAGALVELLQYPIGIGGEPIDGIFVDGTRSSDGFARCQRARHS